MLTTPIPNGAISFVFKGNSGSASTDGLRVRICKPCYNFYETVNCANGMTYYYDFSDEIRGVLMKLQLISASVVAYSILTLALICYTGLSLPF